jgi:hypothetical protein
MNRAKQKEVVPPVDLEKVLSMCRERIKPYPMDCVQYKRIKEQIEYLENIIAK